MHEGPGSAKLGDDAGLGARDLRALGQLEVEAVDRGDRPEALHGAAQADGEGHRRMMPH